VCTLEVMENLVAVVDAGSSLVLTHQRDGIADRANDAPVTQSDGALHRKHRWIRHREIRHGVISACAETAGRRQQPRPVVAPVLVDEPREGAVWLVPAVELLGALLGELGD
jgi:hypothetical protein